MWPNRSFQVIMMGLITIAPAACLVSLDDARPGAKLDRCEELVAKGESLAARDCFDDYYAGEYPSTSDDLRDRVINEHVDCLQAAADSDARLHCKRNVDMASEATQEAVSIVASVEAYDTRVAQEVGEATPERADELTPTTSAENMPPEQNDGANLSELIPIGTYIVYEEVPPDWVLVEGEFVIEVAEDGTVAGSRVYIIEKESGATCTTHMENGHHTIISGQMTGTSGHVSIENASYTIWDSADCGGANNHTTFEMACDREQTTVSARQMEISPISGEGEGAYGFVFRVMKE